jgi:hypothetical protein
MTDHPYNAPNLSARQFLEAVRHDLTVPMHLRVEAAAHLLRVGDDHHQQLSPPPRPTLTIRIHQLIFDDTDVYHSRLYTEWCQEHNLNPHFRSTWERYCRDSDFLNGTLVQGHA